MVTIQREMVLANVARTTIIEPAKRIHDELDALSNKVQYLRKKASNSKGEKRNALHKDIVQCRARMVEIKQKVLKNPSLNISIAKSKAKEFIRNAMLGKSELINLNYPPKYYEDRS